MVLSKYNFYNDDFLSSVGAFIYNTRSGAIICIVDDTAWNNLLLSKFDLLDANLYENLVSFGMITTSHNDEFEDIKKKYHRRTSGMSHLTLTIMPTESCNFACPYCFQFEKKASFMSENVYSQILSLVQDKVRENPSMEEVIINWFGGEPTLCINDIPIFMSQCISHIAPYGIKLFSTITTNGYLLTPEIVQKLVHARVTNIQVTIDGEKSSHNRTRILKNGEGTYDVIMNNLLAISKLPNDISFELSIRCNFTKETFDSVKRFISEFAEKFKHDKRFTIYCRPVYDFETKDNNISSMQNSIFTLEEGIKKQNELSYEICRLLGKNMVERRLVNALPQPTACWCNAEVHSHYIIGPEGQLYVCDTLTGEENTLGHISDNDINDKSKHKRYNIFEDKRTEKCMDCILLPICMGCCMRNRLKTDAQCYWTKESIAIAFSDFIKKTYIEGD